MNKQSNQQLKIAVVMLNWNGEEDSLACIDALKLQTQTHSLVVVDNGSTDNLVAKVKKTSKDTVVIENDKNLGFAGGVNTGIRYALKNGFDYVALINNDALPEDDWLEQLVIASQTSADIGITTGLLLKTDGTIDSTGDLYTSWGLPFPRGRGEKLESRYDKREFVFGATGGASLYNVKMFKNIGLFDEDFFAYYEDVDLSFRAQSAGWRVFYTPSAVAHHKIGASSGRIKGFTTYQTIKNLPWLLWKNVPIRILPPILLRFTIAYFAIIASSLKKGKIVPVLKGLFVSFVFMPKKMLERIRIQKNKTVSTDYIQLMITYDLPPNARKLRSIRLFLKKLRFWR